MTMICEFSDSVTSQGFASVDELNRSKLIPRCPVATIVAGKVMDPFSKNWF